MDGAFIVARDGTVEAACRLIDAPTTGLTVPKGLGNQALGRSSNYGCDQGPCRRRQSVQWYSPAVPGWRGHPPDRTHAPCPRDEMAGYRDRADSSRAFEGRARAGQGQGGSRETGGSGAFGSAPALVNRAGHGNAISHQDPCRADSTGSSSASPLMMHYRSAATFRSSRQPRSRLATVRTSRMADGREVWFWWPVGLAGLSSPVRACVSFWQPKVWSMRSTWFPGGTVSADGSPTSPMSSHRDSRPTLLADMVRRFRHRQPEDPVFLVGKSGGSGLVVKAMEQLEANSLERAILLAPALSPGV